MNRGVLQLDAGSDPIAQQGSLANTGGKRRNKALNRTLLGFRKLLE